MAEDLVLTREQIAECCQRDGVNLDSDWDGASDPIPVLVPSRLNPWTSCRAYVSMENVKKFYLKHVRIPR